MKAIEPNKEEKYVKDMKSFNKYETEIERILKKECPKAEDFNQFLKTANPQFNENFELLQLIGTGSKSFVYKSLFRKNKKEFSTKIIYKEKGVFRNFKEINISQKMKHKNVINTYGEVEIKEGYLDGILMEYAKYGNIRDFQINILKRIILSESLLCFFAFQILNALKYCHRNKIVHYDLKPQNIVIDNCFNFKLIDFSVSLDYSKIDSNKIKLPYRGTSYYMAPEVIKSKTIDIKDLNKVDLFSLGVILYNLAFGNYPFDLKNEDSKTYDEIYKIIKEHKTDYSSHFIDFLKKLLEKDINKRINIEQAINHYWIKGASILLDEKEKLYGCNGCFLTYLMKNFFKKFNEYIWQNPKK